MDYLQAQNKTYDCIVIGGGISGISFAAKLAQLGKNVLILEKEKQSGGQIQTHTIPNHPDFPIELGAHTCYNSYTHLLSIVPEELRARAIPLNKYRYVLSTGEGIKSIFSQLSYFSLMIRGFKIFFFSKTGKSVKEYFRPILGRKNYDNLFSKMFRAVICQQADDYPAEFFLKKRKGRLKEMPRKFSFSKGLSSLINEMITENNLSVCTHTEVTSITRHQDGYQIRTFDGQTWQTPHIAIATNPVTTSQLLKDIEPEISRLLASIPLSYSETFNVTIHKDKLNLQRVAGIISVTDDFMSAVSRDVITHPCLRSFSFHFLKDEKSREAQLALICNLLGIQEKDILSQTFTTHILPSPRKEHTTIINRIDTLRKDDSLFLLGNYFYGLSLEDCAHRSNDEFERYYRLHKII